MSVARLWAAITISAYIIGFVINDQGWTEGPLIRTEAFGLIGAVGGALFFVYMIEHAQNRFHKYSGYFYMMIFLFVALGGIFGLFDLIIPD